MSGQRDNLRKRCECAPALWKKCDHGWHLAKRHDGQRYPVSLDIYAKRRGLDRPLLRGDAETLAARIVKEIETGTYQERPTHTACVSSTPTVSAGLTFDQAIPKFLAADFDEEVVTVGDEQTRLERLADMVLDGVRLGDLALAAVTEDHVETAYRTVVSGRANSTKKKYRGILKRFVAWCVAKKHLAISPITPATTLKAGKPVMRKQRVLRDVEANLVEAAQETRSDAALRLAAMIVVAIELGLRLGELLALQWRDLLWDFGRVYVRAVEQGARKNGEARQVPLTPRAVEWLEKLQVLAPTADGWRSSHYVFGDGIGGRVKSIRKAWETCVLRAHNVQPAWTGTALAADVRAQFQAIDLHFHDLRHECALRWHQEKRYSLGTIGTLLGHTDLSTLRVYLGVTAEEALAEAERINAELAPTGTGGSKTAAKAPTRVVAWGHRKEVKQAVTG